MGWGERGEVGRDEGGEVGRVRGAGRGEGGVGPRGTTEVRADTLCFLHPFFLPPGSKHIKGPKERYLLGQNTTRKFSG